jgi:HAD superfamily hydrolase (TIGR01509 family)
MYSRSGAASAGAAKKLSNKIETITGNFIGGEDAHKLRGDKAEIRGMNLLVTMNASTPPSKEMPATWGAVFDWDGVIIDSRAHHEESWNRLGAERQLPLPEGHFLKGFGRKNEFIIPEILGWTRDAEEIREISLRKEALYREVVAEWGLRALPGVRPWLEQLRAAHVPCAIGSSTHRANIDLSLDIIGMHEFFFAIVTAEDVTRGKPDPEVFLTAAERLSRAPHECVVFEDAHVGIAAAHAGGMRAIGVATTHSLAELGAADLAVTRLDQLDLDTISAWFVTAK